jgi:hypothetical protein
LRQRKGPGSDRRVAQRWRLRQQLGQPSAYSTPRF